MFSKLNRIFAGLTLAATPFLVVPKAEAIPLDDFYKKPVVEQADLLNDSIAAIIDSLNSPIDSKGKTKSLAVLTANRELASYATDLLVVRKGEDSTRISNGSLGLAASLRQAYKLNPAADHGQLTYAYIKLQHKQYVASLEQKKPSLPVATITTASASSVVPAGTLAVVAAPH